MKRYASHPDIGIIRIAPRTEAAARHRAVQISAFMAWVHDFYMRPTEQGGLGLVRLDNVDPPGSPGDIDWRIPGLLQSGPVQLTGKELIGAFRLTDKGRISRATDAMLGYLVLTKPEGHCNLQQHAPTEIVELDSKRRGLAGLLLQQANFHPEDPVQLTVARPNLHAQEIYRHYGMEFTHDDPHRYEIFDVDHLVMESAADQLMAIVQARKVVEL